MILLSQEMHRAGKHEQQHFHEVVYSPTRDYIQQVGDSYTPHQGAVPETSNQRKGKKEQEDDVDRTFVPAADGRPVACSLTGEACSVPQRPSVTSAPLTA